MTITETFADNMRAFRVQSGMTQEKLAILSGLDRTYIGGIEQKRRNPCLRNIEKIANALGVDPLLLFSKADSSSVAECTEKPLLSMQPGDYALATWTEDGVHIEPISVTNPDETLKILTILASEGYGDNIIDAYNAIRTKSNEKA